MGCQTRDDYKYGKAYNSFRQEKGIPIVEELMVKTSQIGTQTVYQVNVKSLLKPTHFSKVIDTLYKRPGLTSEKDVYRSIIDDTTYMQLNILSEWDNDNQLRQRGNCGKVDIRIGDAEDIEKFHLAAETYPNYEWNNNLSLTQIDSILNSWGLKRIYQ